MARFSLLFLFVWVPLSGCGDEDAGGSSAETRGEACEAVGRAACTRDVQCNLSFTGIDTCTGVFVRQCCEEAGDCDAPFEDNTNLDQCVGAIEVAECETFRSSPPESCEPLL